MVGTAAFADAPPPTPPTVNITSPTSASSLVFSSFPATVPVTGDVSFTGGTGNGSTNLCAVKDLTVTVDGEQIGYLDKVGHSNGSPSCEDTFTTWSYPWTIDAAGSYTIKVTAHVSNDVGSDVEQVVVSQQTLTADYPAAPAVAAHILKDQGVSARYGSGKKGGNYISDVAGHMGPQTDFDGVAKDDVDAYEAAVYAFLDNAGAF
jgi:hypothetical protein